MAHHIRNAAWNHDHEIGAAGGGTNPIISTAMGGAGAMVTTAVHLEQPGCHDHLLTLFGRGGHSHAQTVGAGGG
jgi:hypothetical protein